MPVLSTVSDIRNCTSRWRHPGHTTWRFGEDFVTPVIDPLITANQSGDSYKSGIFVLVENGHNSLISADRCMMNS